MGTWFTSWTTRASTWVLVIAFGLVATQVTPSFADLIVIPIWVALMLGAQYLATKGH